MKVIFLDIDGVLNSEQTVKKMIEAGDEGLIGIDPDHVKHLNTIIEKSNAKIVVSSTWRLGRSLDELQKLLDNAGVKGQVVGRTTLLWGEIPGNLLGERYVRGHEIQDWLDHSLPKWKPNGIVILDDDADMAHLEPYLVRTSWPKGLTETHVDLALETLNKPYGEP